MIDPTGELENSSGDLIGDTRDLHVPVGMKALVPPKPSGKGTSGIATSTPASAAAETEQVTEEEATKEDTGSHLFSYKWNVRL